MQLDSSKTKKTREGFYVTKKSFYPGLFLKRKRSLGICGSFCRSLTHHWACCMQFPLKHWFPANYLQLQGQLNMQVSSGATRSNTFKRIGLFSLWGVLKRFANLMQIKTTLLFRHQKSWKLSNLSWNWSTYLMVRRRRRTVTMTSPPPLPPPLMMMMIRWGGWPWPQMTPGWASTEGETRFNFVEIVI